MGLSFVEQNADNTGLILSFVEKAFSARKRLQQNFLPSNASEGQIHLQGRRLMAGLAGPQLGMSHLCIFCFAKKLAQKACGKTPTELEVDLALRSKV